ncbi:hypothetical protein EOK75_10930 [Pseudorhodobacter turbinis]|uniref:Uncharacterized protein n=1 Tax=Pseudorhodobacter turbinis TaxID=2500533 RepID=A0A4P8EHX5_9RHOB|nr:hypothetical protein [Pseudorhodobacter turbinis]QCO56195.1 hypothetical protein EOK75_10930 [Pseudorhodobacter turbinis]
MTVLILLAFILVAFAYIGFAIVPFVTRPAMLFDKGPTHARIMGLLLCGASAVLVFFVFNPDEMAGLKPRFWEAAGLAGFSAIFWVPWYLYAFGRAAAKANALRDSK